MNALPIYYGDTLAGMFYRTDGNVYCLDYEPEWQEGGFALSVHLPLETRHHEGCKVEYYVENLLPEGELRKALATRYGVSSTNYYGLMSSIGCDCAGAFSIGAPQSAGRYEALTQEGLQAELLHLRETHLPVEQAGKSYSLAGAQDKEVLFEENGVFHLPLGGAASNCIVSSKPRGGMRAAWRTSFSACAWPVPPGWRFLPRRICPSRKSPP